MKWIRGVCKSWTKGKKNIKSRAENVINQSKSRAENVIKDIKSRAENVISLRYYIYFQ